MKDYTATATREGKWWVIDVPGVGVTQARNLAEGHAMVNDLIEVMTGEAPASASIVVDVKGVKVVRAKSAQRRIAKAEQELMKASREVRDVVHQLRAAGLTQDDTAIALGVSRQRVQQLAKEPQQRVAAKKAVAPQRGASKKAGWVTKRDGDGGSRGFRTKSEAAAHGRTVLKEDRAKSPGKQNTIGKHT